jgi:hypothetical protein
MREYRGRQRLQPKKELPEHRDGLHWVAGHVWFPISRLKDVFPDLNGVCSRFERFLKAQPCVFDNTKDENKSGFAYQICASGVIQRIVALPEAYGLLKQGKFMVDHLVSPRTYADFRCRLQQAGQAE